MSLLRAFFVAGVVGAVACTSSTDSGPIADHIAVVPTSVSLATGATRQLSAVVYDANDGAISGAVVTYRSDDTTVATVSATGLVLGVSTGLTTVTVTSSPAYRAIAVSVSNPVDAQVAWIELSPIDTVLTGTETVQLTAVAFDSAGMVLLSPSIIYVSRDTSAVTVSATGLVSRHGIGSAFVLARSGSARDSVRVTALAARVSVPGRPIATAVFSASRGYVTQLADGTVQQLNLTTPGTVGTAVSVGSLPTSVSVNGAGTVAYVGNQGSGTVSVISTATNAVTATIPVTTGSILSVLVVPGDSLLLVGTDQSELYLVRLATAALADSFAVAYTNNLAMRGDTSVFANNVFGGTITEINLRTRHVVRTLSVGGVPQGMVISPDGATLYLANEYGFLQLWNLTTGSLVGAIALPGGGGFGLARDPATGLLYVGTSYIGSRVHVIDPSTRTIVHTILTGGTPRRISFTANGSAGFVANEGGWVDFIK